MKAPIPRPAEDPYLTWARCTHFRYLFERSIAPHQPASGPLRLAGELRGGSTLKQAAEAVKACGGRLHAATVLGTGFFTGTLAHPSAAAFNALGEFASVVLAEPGMRSLDADAPQCRNSVRTWRAPKKRPTPLKQRVVVGVVDGLCAFANARFEAGNRFMIDAFWDQGSEDQAAAAWARPSHLRFGRELDCLALKSIFDRLPRSAGASRVAAEEALYRSLAHGTPADADWSHGTHVLDDLFATSNAFSRPGAETPGVVVVQLPEFALRDTSGRWAAAWVLEAIDYIVGHADFRRDDTRVVVNLSLGSFGGPPDGSSLLVRALDAIEERFDGRVVFVVAAGNARRIVDDGTGVEKYCHARFALDPSATTQSRQGQTERTLYWDIDVPDGTESFLELWVSEHDEPGTADGIRVSLAHEGGQLDSGPVDPGGIGVVGSQEAALAMVANCSGQYRVPNGRGGMVLVALGHTSASVPGRTPPGRWSVRIKNRCTVPLTIEARVERRDVPGELRGFRPQYGFGGDMSGERAAINTLTSLAHGRRSVVVGALSPAATLADGASVDEPVIAPYSSEGPVVEASAPTAYAAERRGPDVYAPGKAEATSYFSGGRKSLAGTSVAAARISGAMAASLLIESRQSCALQALRTLAASPGLSAYLPPVPNSSAGGFAVLFPPPVAR